TGEKNRFTFGDAGGQFEVEFAAGFTGQLNTITANSVAQPFDATGGNGAGLSVGADAVALINGVAHTSADQHFTIQGAHGTYDIEFAPGFTGNFDSITIASISQQLQIDGGAAPGLAFGSDAQAIINGQ